MALDTYTQRTHTALSNRCMYMYKVYTMGRGYRHVSTNQPVLSLVISNIQTKASRHYESSRANKKSRIIKTTPFIVPLTTRVSQGDSTHTKRAHHLQSDPEQDLLIEGKNSNYSKKILTTRFVDRNVHE